MALLSTTSNALTSIAVPLAILLVLTGILLAALSYVRRKMRSEASGPQDFTLTQLRELHRQGKLTQEEFERAKSLLVGKVQSTLAKEAKSSTAAPPLGAELKSEETK